MEPILPALGDRACKFIQREAKTAEPFLLYMPLTSPHTPLSVNDEWKGKSGLNLYADFVMETDAVVGQMPSPQIFELVPARCPLKFHFVS